MFNVFNIQQELKSELSNLRLTHHNLKSTHVVYLEYSTAAMLMTTKLGRMVTYFTRITLTTFHEPLMTESWKIT